jgi:hypothetical protein
VRSGGRQIKVHTVHVSIGWKNITRGSGHNILSVGHIVIVKNMAKGLFVVYHYYVILVFEK